MGLKLINRRWPSLIPEKVTVFVCMQYISICVCAYVYISVDLISNHCIYTIESKFEIRNNLCV